MKFKSFINEENDTSKKLMDFFRDNKNPPDKDIHSLANELNIEPDDLEADIYKILSSFMAHGKFVESGKKESDFDSKEIEMGIKVEAEHTILPAMAKRIALDHLVEISDYYTRLKKMEEDAGIKD